MESTQKDSLEKKQRIYSQMENRNAKTNQRSRTKFKCPECR